MTQARPSTAARFPDQAGEAAGLAGRLYIPSQHFAAARSPQLRCKAQPTGAWRPSSRLGGVRTPMLEGLDA
jgi:hypothetical protein